MNYPVRMPAVRGHQGIPAKRSDLGSNQSEKRQRRRPRNFRAVLFSIVVTLCAVVWMPQARAQRCAPEVAKAAVMRADPGMADLDCGVNAICHDFTRSGGDMIAVLSCGSGGVMYWYLFTKTPEGWRLRWKPPDREGYTAFEHGSLKLARGSDDLIASGAIYNPDDAHCCPTGGSVFSRLRWDGNAFRIIRRWRTSPGKTP